MNPRASYKDPITVDDVLNVRHDRLALHQADVLPGHRRRRRADPDQRRAGQGLPAEAGLHPGHRRERRDPDGQPDGGLHLLASAFRVSGKKAFEEAGISHADVDHLMIYDAFAHLPLYGLEDLGFCKPGEAAGFVSEPQHRAHRRRGKLPLNTNGGGLSYMHSGMYGMYALQESVRQMRGIAPAQVPGAKISIAHGVGGMFAASGTIVFSNEAP